MFSRYMYKLYVLGVGDATGRLTLLPTHTQTPTGTLQPRDAATAAVGAARRNGRFVARVAQPTAPQACGESVEAEINL